MTDNNDDKTLHVTGKKTLTLKPSGLTQGTVRQDMGRGRTKAVVVETRKRRPGGRDEALLCAPASCTPASINFRGWCNRDSTKLSSISPHIAAADLWWS